MFRCPHCGVDPLKERGCQKCPTHHLNILGISEEKALSYNDDNFREKYPVYFKKYDKERGGTHGIVYQYDFVLNKLKLYEGVVLDFGCALSHASQTVKAFSPHLTYIGVDIVPEALLAGQRIYPTADYLGVVPSRKAKKEGNKTEVVIDPGCLNYIPDNSVDLVIASRIAGWKSQSSFLPEFYRVLKPGGHLFFWSNAGHFDNQKMSMFSYLDDYFNPIKKSAKTPDKYALSKMLWGNKKAYKNPERSEEEIRYKFRGLFMKPPTDEAGWADGECDIPWSDND